MSSGGKGGNGGLRATERKGQDGHRGAGRRAGCTRGPCANLKTRLLLWADARPGRVTGLGKQSAGWILVPPSPPCAVNSLYNPMRTLMAKQPKKQSRRIQKTGSKTKKSREFQGMDDEWHCMRNALANVGKKQTPPSKKKKSF